MKKKKTKFCCLRIMFLYIHRKSFAFLNPISLGFPNMFDLVSYIFFSILSILNTV